MSAAAAAAADVVRERKAVCLGELSEPESVCDLLLSLGSFSFSAGQVRARSVLLGKSSLLEVGHGYFVF